MATESYHESSQESRLTVPELKHIHFADVSDPHVSAPPLAQDAGSPAKGTPWMIPSWDVSKRLLVLRYACLKPAGAKHRALAPKLVPFKPMGQISLQMAQPFLLVSQTLPMLWNSGRSHASIGHRNRNSQTGCILKDIATP